jgi:hypothetical protein
MVVARDNLAGGRCAVTAEVRFPDWMAPGAPPLAGALRRGEMGGFFCLATGFSPRENGGG